MYGRHRHGVPVRAAAQPADERWRQSVVVKTELLLLRGMPDLHEADGKSHRKPKCEQDVDAEDGDAASDHELEDFMEGPNKLEGGDAASDHGCVEKHEDETAVLDGQKTAKTQKV